VKRRRTLGTSAGIVISVLLGLVAPGCGDDGADEGGSAPATTETPAVPCEGEPVVVGLISTVDGVAATPGIQAGVEAAERAVNHGCRAGRPLEVVSCDDHGDPNQAADCGREIVDSGAIALVAGGYNGITVDSYEPIVQEAGIPSVGNLGSDPSELTGATSFPFYPGMTRIAASGSIFRAAGAETVSFVLPDEPGVQAMVPTFQGTIERAGLTVDRFVFVPLDATDLAQYVSQAAEADAVMIFTDTKAEGFLHGLLSAGITPRDKVILAPALSQDEVDELGGQVDGLYMSAQTMPLSETSNEGIAAYLSEAEAAGVTDTDLDGLLAWRALHVVADLVEQLPQPDAASLTEALTTYSFAPPEAAPVDFTEPAFPDDPVLGRFRIFSRSFFVWQVENGEIGLALPHAIDPDTDFELG
jgi:ABC-type branched-subunit amino acid transport system substrate-binding protein